MKSENDYLKNTVIKIYNSLILIIERNINLNHRKKITYNKNACEYGQI